VEQAPGGKRAVELRLDVSDCRLIRARGRRPPQVDERSRHIANDSRRLGAVDAPCVRSGDLGPADKRLRFPKPPQHALKHLAARLGLAPRGQGSAAAPRGAKAPAVAGAPDSGTVRAFDMQFRLDRRGATVARIEADLRSG